MNLTTLRDALESVLQENLEADAGKKLFTSTEADAWFNIALVKAASVADPMRLRALQAIESGTGAAITIPSTCLRPYMVVAGGETYLLQPPGVPEGDTAHPYASAGTGAVVWGSTVTLPASAIYKMHYIKSPSELVATSQEVIDLPSEFHYALVYYAAYLASHKAFMPRPSFLQMFYVTLGLQPQQVPNENMIGEGYNAGGE